jgi:hypothetical protein
VKVGFAVQVAEPDQPSRTRAFIAISLGLTPPACAIQSITFLSDTLCCVEVTSSTVTGSARSSMTKCCSANSLQPERGCVHGCLRVDGDRVIDVPDIPKRTRHSRSAMEDSVSQRRTKGEHNKISW